jgi:hypothetical protein
MLLLEGDKLLRFESFGEDTCELVHTIEDSFGVKFAEDELIHARTVGAMAQIIFKKVKQPAGPQCLSAITFYKLRRAFMEMFGTPRAKMSPATSLYELMPWKTRREQWRSLQDYLNFVLPQLTWPAWLMGIALVFTGSTLYFLFGLKLLRGIGSASVLVGIVGFIALLVPVCLVLNPIAREFPRGCVTLGDLTKLVLARNYGKVAARHGMSSEREVIQLLLFLVAEETATDIQKLSSDTRFPEDLGIY